MSRIDRVNNLIFDIRQISEINLVKDRILQCSGRGTHGPSGHPVFIERRINNCDICSVTNEHTHHICALCASDWIQYVASTSNIW